MASRSPRRAKGVYWSSQIAIGHDNALRLRLYGTKGAIEWFQEAPNNARVSFLDRPTGTLSRGRDPMSPRAQSLSRLPSGHPEGYFEAFANVYAAYIAALAKKLRGEPLFNNLGRLLHDSGSPGAAESSYRLAICADPGVALYWFNLGVAVEDQGRRAEAIAAYERAIELDEGTGDAHYNLARLLELTGRRTGDELMLRRAVRHLLRYRELTRRNARAH